MLRLRLPSKTSAPVRIRFRTRGTDIYFHIRPYSVELDQEIEKRHTKFEIVRDPDTRQMVKVPIVNRDALMDEKIDTIVADMEGVEIEDEKTGQIIPNTDIRAKKAVLLMKQPDGEPPIFQFVFDTARELAIKEAEEIAEQEKN